MQSRRDRSGWTYRVLLWSFVALAATLVYLQREPLVLAPEFEPADGAPVTREATSDVVVVLDYDAISASGTGFSGRDWSAAWINLVEQEFGPATISTPRSLSTQLLREARTVILTHSVAGRLSSSLLDAFSAHVRRGNLLVVERPEGALREAFAANGRGGARRGRAVTYARDLPEPYRSQLREMPLSTEYVGSTEARQGATTLMAIDGAPVIYALPVGDGHVVTVDFDLGEQLVSLQQGRPSEDFEVGAGDERGDVPRTAALVADEKLLGATVPHADLLERFVVHGILARYAPAPVFWPFPGDADGLVVSIHEDTSLGDGGGWMLAHEREHGASSTLLATVDSGLTAAGAAVIGQRRGEIGLLWRLAATPSELREPVGVAGFAPMARPLTLEAQLERLADTLPRGTPRSTKTVDGWWHERWDHPFRLLAAADVALDFSYDPRSSAGFAFGTGLPFRVLSHEGLPLGPREMPVVVPAQALGADEPGLRALLEASQRGHHQAMVVSTAPSQFTEHPQLEHFEAWIQIFTDLEETNHRMVDAARFREFRGARRASSLTSRLVRDVAAPRHGLPGAATKTTPDEESETEGTGGDDSRATLLRVTAEARGRSMSIVVPERIGSRRFLLVRQQANRVGEELVSGDVDSLEVSLVGLPMRRISLDRGYNSLDIYYR